MATRDRGAEAPPCSVCGGVLNSQGECTVCGTKHDPNGRALPTASVPAREEVVHRFTEISGVGETKARALYDHGFTSLESLRDGDVEEMAKVPGIGERLAKAVREKAAQILAVPPPPAAPETSPHAEPPPVGRKDEALERWLSGGGSQGLSQWLGGEAKTEADPRSDDALRRWLSGEEDNIASWLGEVQARVAADLPISGDEGALLEQARLLESREAELKMKDEEVDGLRVELDSVKKAMAEDLRNIKTGKFDPLRYVEETARLNRELQAEIKKRRELEQEIDHIKKGSIAVIRYVKAQQMKAVSPELKRKLAEESNARTEMERELKKTQEVLANLRKQVDAGLQTMKPDEKALKALELDLVEKEANLRAKEEELKALEEAARRGEVDLNGAGVPEELRSRLQEELREKEEDYFKKEEELKRRIIHLEEEVSRYQIDEKLREESEALASRPKTEIESALAEKEKDLMSKEKSIMVREQEIQRLKDELEFTQDELGKLKQQVAYKDEELIRREEDLLYREKLLSGERRKVEEAKAQGFTTEEKELKDRLEQLKTEIVMKEEEVRAKEKYLKAKMEELRLREQGLIEEEIEAREEERILEVKQEKIKTGTPRLDDLLLGGIPFGSNVSIYGPAYVGKEVILNTFLGEGLKKGVPTILVITDKTPNDVREEMKFVIPGYEEYERLGLVKYVDAYSRSMGSEESDPYAVYVADPTDHEAILKTVDEVAKEFKKQHEYYRLAFRSISTLIAYLDPTTTFRFLQPFAGRRKRDKAVSFYVLEKGMHGEQDIQMLGSVMDGSIEIKVEQLKSYLAVKGICDVQSRAWIRYTYSKGAVNIGSFSLDHIR